MPSTTLRWNSDRVISRARSTMLARGNLAAEALERQVKARVGAPYPPASLPGQPPHRRTGALQRGIHVTARLLANRVRVSVTALAFYAKFLQLGTRGSGNRPGMAARPFVGFPADARLIVDFLSGRRRR